MVCLQVVFILLSDSAYTWYNRFSLDVVIINSDLNCEFFMHVYQSVLDGDLCEQFNSMEYIKRKAIAEELDRTPAEV